MKSKLKEECMDRAGEIQERRVADRRAEQHAPCYYDTDRNKPLPNAASNCATHATIIAAKDGEIAALTAEVTHLAEKVAERDALLAASDLNGGMHASIFVKVWGDAGGGDAGRIALANYAFELGKKAASAVHQPVDAAQAVPRLPTANGRPIETDAAHRLRLHATNANLSQDLRKALTSGADECDRYYGGMMAWKKTAEKKDADWNAERMARVDERCASRLATAAAQAVPETGLPILSEERITTIATELALNVANNASSVPQLCFPHIYLGLKDLFAADPVKPTDTTKGA